jgi:hypothetical protein
MLCILCGGSVQPLFSARDYRRPADRTEYILNWCDRCEFGRLEGKFTPDTVKDFYDIAYYTHVPVTASITGTLEKRTFWERLRCHLAWRVDRGADFQAIELGASRERTVCDIGCGSSSKLEALRNAGFQVTGIEPDENARSLAVKKAEVFDGTAERLPLKFRSEVSI